MAGTRLDVSLKFAKADTPPVELSIVDALGQSLSGVRKQRATGIQVKGIIIPATGRYFVQVVPLAPFEGTVKLSLKVTAPKKAAGQISLAGAPPREVEFGTLAGARVTITVKAARGSDVVPTIHSVMDDTGAELLIPAELRLSGNKAVLEMKTDQSWLWGRFIRCPARNSNLSFAMPICREADC